jgi:hypothetical protein
VSSIPDAVKQYVYNYKLFELAVVRTKTKTNKQRCYFLIEQKSFDIQKIGTSGRRR